ncbi:hypothetical protein D5085_01035 [Ectothiorhodospiraceae bacterium BW-2]|nr:hypothetical protein D5085_01035 [Ectothiorhodospiraceae bacterium BW-2]
MLRGGSWNNNTNNLRAANRNRNNTDNRNNNNGFRLLQSACGCKPPTRTAHFTESAGVITGIHEHSSWSCRVAWSNSVVTDDGQPGW